MYLRPDSAAGVRFLSWVREGRGLKASARAAGVGKETCCRWLREVFFVLRSQDIGVDEAQATLATFATCAGLGMRPARQPR